MSCFINTLKQEFLCMSFQLYNFPFFFTTICDFCVYNCFFSKPLINKTKIYTSAYTYNNNKADNKNWVYR